MYLYEYFIKISIITKRLNVSNCLSSYFDPCTHVRNVYFRRIYPSPIIISINQIQTINKPLSFNRGLVDFKYFTNYLYYAGGNVSLKNNI